MSARAAEPTGADADTVRITPPDGKIHLGRRMVLQERAAPTSTSWSAFATGLPDDGTIAPIDSPFPPAVPGELAMQSLQQSLEPTEEELYIEGDGLALAYGIFGAPGSGKTFLMMRMLRQLLELCRDDPDRKFGMLLLDPKAALIADVTEMAARVRRADDLVVIGGPSGQDVNIIHCDLDAYELARALVLAAQSAGVGASEPYWFGAWQNLFAAAIQVLQWVGGPDPVSDPAMALTLHDIVSAALTSEDEDGVLGYPRERGIARQARVARDRLDELDEDARTEMEVALDQIETFYVQKPEDVAVVENLITQAYGAFLRTKTRRYSASIPNAGDAPNLYDRVMEDGTLVLVSISPSEPGLAKVLCTLVKNLFMQSVRSRFDRVRAGRLHNCKRLVLIGCDEYSQVASEVPGQVGDGDFFSIARAAGCMGILATQSVNVLQATSLKENWRSVFSNFSAKIFMRAVDNETVEEATKLAGETDWYVTSQGTSSGAQGVGSSTNRELRERKGLPATVLTQLICTGQGVIVGSLDGHSTPATYFLAVPKD